ncbi:MAG: GNAT family N-acetyltransferase [Synoicihabitans sp.]
MRLMCIVPSSDQFEAWRVHQIRAYAREKVANGSWSELEAPARAEADNQALLPAGFETVGHHIRRIENSDTNELVAWIWVGLATSGPPDLAWLYDIEIVPEHRGQGHGKAVMHLAEQEARNLGCTRLGLHVFAANQVARQLYASSGYEVTDLCMEKVLPPSDG